MAQAFNERHQEEDKPVLLQAVESILADPKEILKEVRQMEKKYHDRYASKKSAIEIKDVIVSHIISNYSYYTAFTGGATGLTGVIPGLGQVIAMVGGASADVVLTMKWEIEMVMAIAAVYGHNITLEEEKRICYIVAGLGAISEAAKEGGKAIGSKAFIKMTEQYLKGPTLVAVKQVFKKVGITFTRKAVQKAIPFGVGVVVGFGMNKTLTYYVGKKAKDFFRPRGDIGSLKAEVIDITAEVVDESIIAEVIDVSRDDNK